MPVPWTAHIPQAMQQHGASTKRVEDSAATRSKPRADEPAEQTERAEPRR